MVIGTFLSYFAVALPAFASLPKQSEKLRRSLVLAAAVVGCALVYVGAAAREAALSQARRDEEARAASVAVQNHDLLAHLRAEEERSRLIAEGCISDPKLRREAVAAHPELGRAISEELRAADKATVWVGHPGGKGGKPLRP